MVEIPGGFKPTFDKMFTLDNPYSKVTVSERYSDNVKQVANNLHQKIVSSLKNQGINANVNINAGFKDEQPILYIAAYDNGKSVMRDAESTIRNNLPEGAVVTVEDNRAEILLPRE